jgi:hypothetical protein
VPAAEPAAAADGDPPLVGAAGRVNRRPPTSTVAPVRATSCTVFVQGAPPSMLRNSVVVVQQTRHPLEASTKIEVELRVATAVASIVSDVLRGSVRLDRATCARGPVRLNVRIHPAEISFRGLPPGAAAACIAGCPRAYPTSWQEPTHVRPLHLDRPSQRVTFELKAAGFRGARETVLLHPGRNVVRVELEPR